MEKKDKMRIDKFVSKVYNLSRNDSRQFIKKNDFYINDIKVTKNDQLIDLDTDTVFLNGEAVNYKPLVYLMLNKPKGYLSATSDDHYPTVIDLIKGYENYDLFMVGRLDLDTEGLLLITNDGKFAHNLTSPKKDCLKKYYLETDLPFEECDIETMKCGMELYDGNGNLYLTKPATLEIISDCKAYLTISEGKYHQVKKMSKKVGKEVLYLKRVAIGSLSLDETLDIGSFRPLSDEEVKSLK